MPRLMLLPLLVTLGIANPVALYLAVSSGGMAVLLVTLRHISLAGSRPFAPPGR